MNHKIRLQRLEAQAAPQGHCPHSHQVVKIIAPDGHDSRENEFPKTCECGQAIELFEIQFVAFDPAIHSKDGPGWTLTE
jgi:hypothetical protein